MKLPELSGWQRLGVATSLLWVAVVGGTALCESILPTAHGWINAAFVDPDDPVRLLPRVVWSRLYALLLVPLSLLWLLGASCAWVRSGFEKLAATAYNKSGRLSDVLALVQVLALDEFPHRGETNLQGELQGKPRSAETWARVALEHPEFFRVNATAEFPVSLVSRHVLPKNTQGAQSLDSDFIAEIMKLAIELHDRQLRRVQAWQVFVPLLVAVVSGAIALVGIALTR